MLVTKKEVTVACTIGENRIFRNGTEIPNDAAAVIRDGRTYLPIRAVLEALDATVGWNGSVRVTRPGAGSLIQEYVGISAYYEYSPETDPLQRGSTEAASRPFWI